MFDFVLSCLIVFLPLGSAVISGLFGKTIGQRNVHLLANAAIGISCLLSIVIAKKIFLDGHTAFNFKLYTWGKIGSVNLQIGFLIDRLTAWMMLVVTFVSWMVHIYTIGYMQGDPGYQRFFSYISLFTFGMLMLIMSNNFLQLFFGWEMVGLMSYLLIGFWFQKESAVFANLKAFVVNRVGDFGFILGIAGILYYFGTLDYLTVFSEAKQIPEHVITLICACLFLGAMGKSAQVPLHVWLPDSMEGPTPISALIHAATMVTAGVFMLARLSPLFEYSDVVLNIVLTIGALTCLLMGLVGVVQNDIKRIIAYSTLSQLGYMMAAMGVSAYPIGIFHLTTHAFFKALLFLCAGSVILALHHEQDIWKMGNLKKYMPVTYITMLIGSLALIGFPLFSGFYSKDLIIEAVRLSHLPAAPFAYWIVLGSVFITALYTFRLFFVVFYAKQHIEKTVIPHVHESPPVIGIPLVLLAVPSLISGICLTSPMLQDFFKGAIFIHPNHPSFTILQEEFKGTLSMTLHAGTSLPFWLALGGVFTTWLFYISYPKLALLFQNKVKIFYCVLKNKFGFDAFNQWVLAAGTRAMGWLCWQIGDRWLIDGIGVNGTARTIGRFARLLRQLQTGYLYHYAFAMILGFLFLLTWLML
jgi:NADH-quinone oxidoreductase subunit L